ncbi:aromatic amino acid lyase [Microbacteriaceae bacterium VKM Ac-2855]|nr:aromatic amino acid lyase [Microbacteriaceae bacterium VKM Ac-2855]
MIELDGNAGVRDIAALSDRRDTVSLAPGVLLGIADAARAASDIAEHSPVYGRSTGVGANRTTVVSADADHALRLLRSHAVDAGPTLPERAVRAMLAVRLNQLCIPGSGIAPEVLIGLLRMLQTDALPEVRMFGSVGTGDIGALAGTALALLGERPVARSLPPTAPWGAESALAFVSSAALSIGRACLIVDELEQLERAARVIFTLSSVALGADPGAVSARAATASTIRGASEVSEAVRALLTGVSDPILLAARVQDPYGLRVFPQTQGGLVDALGAFVERTGALVRAGQENPLFDVDARLVMHHGAFFQSGLAHAAEAASLALAGATATTLSRIRLLNDPEYTDLRPFLAAGAVGSSGLMMVEYVAASAIAEIRSAAQPASLGTVSLSRGTEDDAPFTPQSITQLERALPAYRVLLSCEVVGAARALRQRERHLGHSGALGRAVSMVASLPAADVDRDLRADLDSAAALLGDLATLIPSDG